jgi:glycosyltransferase involved in cell wall biosynthesis
MKLLMSCYECSPVRGSESGVGWNWVREARRLGHDVWVLVAPTYEEEIKQGCSSDELASGARWVFPQSGLWRLKAGERPKAERRHNLLWQVAALNVARELHRSVRFDAIQHVTWGGIRYPSFLGRLDAPFILGPVGGGETSPRGLRDTLTLRNMLVESLRDFSNATLDLNPFIRRMLEDAAVIIAKTEETRDLVPARLRHKTRVFLELGVSPNQINRPREFGLGPPRLLFVGRLLYWKGAHLALAALEALRETLPGVRLTVVGHGPEEMALRAEARRRGLADVTTFVPWMPQASLFELYREHDLFVFPSLHDSSGNVVLESLCHGLPVVCLDLGGPKEIVTGACGVVVGTGGLTTESTANALAAAISNLLRDPVRLRALSVGAVERASEFAWPERIAAFYQMISPYLERGRAGQKPWVSAAQ